tara:strand:+ start:1769 stop:2155 length:387 start_codon:yes stop_codon:yes gene_type:complete
MGFHKRYISNDQVIDIFRSQGIDGVKSWYTQKVDAVITEAGLSSDIYDLMHLPGINQDTIWDKISNMIMNERYYDRLTAAEQIEEILQEANGYGLRAEVIMNAKKFIKQDPKLNRVAAFQMSYDEWIK